MTILRVAPGARRHRWLRALPAFVLASLVAPLAARADLIVLTTGESIRGTVKGATEASLVIEVDGRERTIAQPLVLGIEFEPPARVGDGEDETPAATEASGAAMPPPTGARSERAPTEAPATTPAEGDASSQSSEESEAAGTRPETVAGLAPTPPPLPPRPSIDLESVSPKGLREALEALLVARDAAASGASFTEYQAAVDEAQARVESYLKDRDDRSAVKRAVASASRLFTFAATAWGAFDAKGDLRAVGQAPVIVECPRLQRTIERDAHRWQFKADDPAFVGLMAGSEGLPDLWACASERIEEVARLITAR